MYFDKIALVWIIGLFDIFMLSLFSGSMINYFLQKYLDQKNSEETAIKLLKKSIIKKSKLTTNSDLKRVEKIYTVALRGGQLEDLNKRLIDKICFFVEQIRKIIEKLACYLKKKS